MGNKHTILYYAEKYNQIDIMNSVTLLENMVKRMRITHVFFSGTIIKTFWKLHRIFYY